MKKIAIVAALVVSVAVNVWFGINRIPTVTADTSTQFQGYKINPNEQPSNFSTTKTAPRYLKNWEYNVQLDMFKQYSRKQMPIVMLGDSITYYGRWNELLGVNGIANRGIPGDLTSGFLHRMQYVYNVHPKICFVMGGINDISQGATPESVYANMVAIIKGLQTHHITPVIESALYITKDRTDSTVINQRVHSLNVMLNNYTQTHHIDFMNVNAEFQKGGYMQSRYTYDGVHPSALGYHVWSDMIATELKRKHIRLN